MNESASTNHNLYDSRSSYLSIISMRPKDQNFTSYLITDDSIQDESYYSMHSVSFMTNTSKKDFNKIYCKDRESVGHKNCSCIIL